MARRFIAGIILIVTLVTVLFTPQTTYAAKVKTSKELEKSIEKQYGISITLSGKLQKDEKGALSCLKDLELALNMMPKGLIKALVKHYKTKGKATTISLSISSATAYGTAAANYNFDKNTINLFIPAGASMWGSGSDPHSIIHEFGHMVQNALYGIYGSKKLKSEFTSLNGKIKYKDNINWNLVGDEYRDSFVNSYAATKFDEDFAETFAASIVGSEWMRGIYKENENSVIIKKSIYIKKLIEKQLKIKISQDDWEIYPQKPSKKYEGKLRFENTNFGVDFEDKDNYQYKIVVNDFYYYLREFWMNATQHTKDAWWEYNMSKDGRDHYEKTIRSAENEYDDFVNKYTSNRYEEIKMKRKDVALVLAGVAKHFSMKDISKEEVTALDCDGLTSKYKKAIEKVVNIGLMDVTKEGKFNPESYCSYEQFYYAIIKAYERVVDQ